MKQLLNYALFGFTVCFLVFASARARQMSRDEETLYKKEMQGRSKHGADS